MNPIKLNKMAKQKNILGVAIKKWMGEAENQKKWNSKKKELKQFAAIFKQLQNHPDFYIPLRLACSVYLTRGSNNKRIQFPKTYEEFLSIWNDIKPKKNEAEKTLSNRFTIWLNSRGNYRYAKKFGQYYADYFKNFNPVNDYKTLQTLNDKSTIKKFWMRYKGVGIEYSKNIPMDEMSKEFINSIKIDARLNNLIKNTPYEKLSNKAKEGIFLDAGKQNGLNGWEVDRICYNFKSDIKNLLKY